MGQRCCKLIFGTSEDSKDDDLPYDHGEVPLLDLPAVLFEEGQFCIWTPLGKRPDPACNAKQYLSVRHDKLLHHLPINMSGKKVWICQPTKKKEFKRTNDNNVNPIAQLVDYYGTMENPISPTTNQPVKLTHPADKEVIELQLLAQIGEGHFATVLRGIMTRGRVQTPVAVKKLKKVVDDAARDEFLKESRLMRLYNHPHIIQMYCVTFQQEHFMIIMELVKGGSLLSYLKKFEGLTPINTLVDFSKDCVRGMAYLESRNCIHRDLAARNCLLDKHLRVKIGDFGLSINAKVYHMQDYEKIPWRWTAPEALSDHVYTSKSDVWSFGVLLFEIFAEGRKPYGIQMTSSQLREEIQTGRRLQKPKIMPPIVATQMERCFQIQPQDRPTFAELETLFLKIKRSRTSTPRVRPRLNRPRSMETTHSGAGYSGRPSSSSPASSLSSVQHAKLKKYSIEANQSK